MKRQCKFQYILWSLLFLSFTRTLLAQGTPERTLVVNGTAISGKVVQIEGRSYVNLETLAQITRASVSEEPDKVVLTIPSPSSAAPPPPVKSGLSKGFEAAAIAALADMREWKGAIAAIISYGMPVVGSWPSDYRDRVEEAVGRAKIAASTTEDQDAVQLLHNEFTKLKDWAAGVVSTRQSLNASRSVDPNALENDRALANIVDCGRFLNGMIVSGTFSDNTSCH
jgi:hypothetical protein